LTNIVVITSDLIFKILKIFDIIFKIKS